jgi:hypothetical protein
LINFCHAPRHLNNFIQMVFFSSVNPRLGGPDKKHQLFQDCWFHSVSFFWKL